MSGWIILCDFDGTIATDDVTDTLLKRFARPGWERLEQQWLRGDIGSRQCMAGQVALLDADQTELDALLDDIPIDPDFAAFAAQANSLDMPLQVISDGLDYAIERILARHGLGHLPVYANHLRPEGARRWRMSSPYASPSCASASGTCKCTCASRERRYLPQNIMLIGDGRSDFCVAQKADFVLAKHHLIAHCQDNQLPHAPIRGFADAMSWLSTVRQRDLHAVAEPLSLSVCN